MAQTELSAPPQGADTDSTSDESVELLLAMSSEPQGNVRDDLDRVLELATKFFGQAFGIVSRVEGDVYHVENVFQPEGAGIAIGAEFNLGTTYCNITLAADDVISIDDMRTSEYGDHPCYEAFGLASYLGVPLVVDGTVFGTLNFSAPEPRELAWTETDRQLARLLARWVESNISAGRLRKRLTSALADRDRASHDLAVRNANLDGFVHAASHDLQAPLRRMSMLTEMLEEELGEIPEAAQEYMTHIQDEARRMSNLLQDLLTFSKTGTTTIDDEDVELDRCIDDAMQALQEVVKESEALVQREPLPAVPGQASLLTQVFQNLISNAIKYQPDGNRPSVDIAGETDGEHVRIRVSDNGIGIEPRYREQIFTPFERLHNSDAYEGTGLGLAICRKILTRHGGDIEIMPSEIGTTFEVTLPA